MRKYSIGMIEIGMKYVERTIYTNNGKFYIKFNHSILEVKHFDDDIWYLI